MPIETICQSCARKLRVGDEFAGRKARCPHCKHVYTVPQSIDASIPEPGNTVSAGEQWRLRTEDGSVYGPVDKAEVDVWLTEGRVTADSHLQRTGSYDWIPAVKIYPALAKSNRANEKGGANPFAAETATSANPYISPVSTGPVARRPYQRPHRGGTILVLGVIGVSCCFICAPIAWIMGQGDLKLLREGRMDPSGRGLTQAGMVLGIIGTVIIALQVIVGMFGVVLD